VSSVTDTPLTETEYRSRPGWSVSQWKMLPLKPELFYAYFIAPPDSPEHCEFAETAGMLFGTNCHAEFLEGKVCSEIPADVLTSNGQRRGTKWDAYKATHSALECLNAKEMAAVNGIRRSIESQPEVADLLWGAGPVELPLFRTDPTTGLAFKFRLDKLRKSAAGLVVVDFKVTNIDPDNEREVSMQVHKMGYVQQLAAYYDAVEDVMGESPVKAILVFAKAKPPYTVRAWKAGEVDLTMGRNRNATSQRDLADRLQSGDWHTSRHNRVNEGADGFLSPSWSLPSAGVEAPKFSEFAEFATAIMSDNEE
jgi:hypothetical protein